MILTIDTEKDDLSKVVQLLELLIGDVAPLPLPTPPPPKPTPKPSLGFGDNIGGINGRQIEISEDVETKLREALTYTAPQTIKINYPDVVELHHGLIIHNPHLTLIGGKFCWAHKSERTDGNKSGSMIHVTKTHDIRIEDMMLDGHGVGQEINVSEPDKSKAGFWQTEALLIENSERVLVKNVHGRRANDEIFDVWQSNHVSFVDCLASEAPNHSTHNNVWEWSAEAQQWKKTSESHSFGMLVGNGSGPRCHHISLIRTLFVACGNRVPEVKADDVEIIGCGTVGHINSCIKVNGERVNVVGNWTLPNGHDTRPTGGLNPFAFFGLSQRTSAYVDRNTAPKAQVYNPDGFTLAEQPFELATDVSSIKPINDASLAVMLTQVGTTVKSDLQKAILTDVLKAYSDPSYKMVIAIPE